MDKQQSIVPIPKLNLFTPQAKTRWNSIEKKNQARILQTSGAEIAAASFTSLSILEKWRECAFC